MPFYMDFHEEFSREIDPKQILLNANLGNINENIILYTNNSKDELQNIKKDANSIETSNDNAKFANISPRNKLENIEKKSENNILF